MVKPKRIQYRYRIAEIQTRCPNTGEPEWLDVSLRHARLYNPMTDYWRWYATINEIPTVVMVHLSPEEREQVRRLLGNQKRTTDSITYQHNV